MSINKVKRGLQLGKLAGSMIMHRATRHRVNSSKTRAHLIERLGHLHGLPQKMAQILALSELESETQDYTPLTEYEATLTYEEISAEIQKALGQSPEQLFLDFSPEGISASLGQVHAATLKDGRKVAVKVQYPGIAESLDTDLKALGWLAAPVGGLKKGFNLSAYQDEMGQMLRKELDYQHEVQMLRTFGEYAQSQSWLSVPEVIPEATRDHVITMTWLEGHSFHDVLDWESPLKAALAEHILRFFLRSCFEWKILHSDPHPGNYRFKKHDHDVEIGLLDFGCIKVLDPAFVSLLETLIWRLIEAKDQPCEVSDLYLGMGFNSVYLAPMEHKLFALSRLLFEPFLTNKPFRIQDWNLASRVNTLLGDDRWNFRFAGSAKLIFFMRTYQGLLKYLKALDSPVNWHPIFLELVDDPRLSEKNNDTLKRLNTLSTSERPRERRSLRIKLTRGEETLVLLKYRVEMVKHLHDLIPEEIYESLEKKSIDVNAIQQKAIESDYAEGILFELSEDDRYLRVWLADDLNTDGTSNSEA